VINKPTAISINRLLYTIGAIVFVTHFFHLSIYLVDIPTMDEWGGASFYPGLQQPELNWDFIFAPHNTHRIVPTRLSYWLLQHYADLNFATLALISFFLYGGVCYVFLKGLETRFKVPMGQFYFVLATTALHENHFWAFGSQFHFCLGFFFLAVHAALKDGVYRYTSLAWIAGSLLSFASGAPYAVSLILLFLFQATVSRRRIESLGLAVAVAAMTFLWVQSAPISAGAITSPRSAEYWNYFTNLLASGFGYTTIDPIPGVVIALVLGVVSCTLAIANRESTQDRRNNIAGLLTLAVGLTAALASTSMGRVGMNSPKTSRYVELGIFLIPVLWLMLRLALLSVPSFTRSARGKLAINGLSVLLAAGLVLPFAQTFDYKTVYKPMFRQKQVTAACVRKFLHYGGSATCPIPALRDVTPHIKAAKEANLLYIGKP
jgi:hypothetical protein